MFQEEKFDDVFYWLARAFAVAFGSVGTNTKPNNLNSQPFRISETSRSDIDRIAMSFDELRNKLERKFEEVDVELVRLGSLFYALNRGVNIVDLRKFEDFCPRVSIDPYRRIHVRL